MPEFNIRRRARTRRPMVKTTEADNLDLVDRYDVIKGFGSVEILWNRNTLENIYSVVEPKLDEYERKLINILPKEMEMVIPNLRNFSTEYVKLDVGKLLDIYCKNYEVNLGEESREKIKYYLNRDFSGLGAIEVIVRDPYVEDISCDGYNVPIFVYHRKYGSIKTNVSFKTKDQLNSYVIKLAQICGKEISVSEPILDGATPNGHRVQAIYGEEISTRGSTFTFRLFREKPFTPVELIKFGTASAEMVTYFWYMIEYYASALIAGVPAVGKTSTMNAILMLVPPNAKIFSIEETREINILHNNWVATSTREAEFESNKSENGGMRIDMFELVKMAMRQRPTYIVVGEVRGREASSLFQAMSTGHTTYSTIHADSMEATVNRLESAPLNIPRIMITYLNTVIFNKFVRTGDSVNRRITEVDEMSGYNTETNEVVYNKVFSYDSFRGKHSFMGYSNLYKKVQYIRGIGASQFKKEFDERRKLLEEMVKSDITNYADIHTIITTYYRDPEKALTAASGGTL
ncbi:MAG: type II/IV secretion system ATPase subunit [Candidatus Thermoplasmatota archaeon]|nr:type II/IV secretion system ATPase subunit [Candidatus Thermoplasmatota archaeon]MCL5730752.1 type II/IV secretion system ATPase subunit [Candidatus Thermoplasmatota archaeon]